MVSVGFIVKSTGQGVVVLESIFSFKANFFSSYLEHFKYMFTFINIETIYRYNQSPKSTHN